MREADLRTLATWLSADYALAAPEGEVRMLVASYLRYVRLRDGLDRREVRELLDAMRASGWTARRGPLTPIEETPWRRLAQTWWGAGEGLIPQKLELPAKDGAAHVSAVVAIATSRLLRSHPEVNLQLQGGRTWARGDACILIPVRVAPGDLRALFLDVADLAPKQVIHAQHRCATAALRAERRHPGLATAGLQIAASWTAAGYGPPAGALVSLAGDDGLADGLNALPPGIVFGVCCNSVPGGTMTLGVQVDHRALDREHSATIGAFLKKEVEALCARW